MLARGILEPAPPTKRRAGPQRKTRSCVGRARNFFVSVAVITVASHGCFFPITRPLRKSLRAIILTCKGVQKLGGRAIEPLKREKAKARSGMRTDLVQNCHEVMGKTRDIVAREGRNAAFAAPPHAPSLSEETYVGQNRHASCDPDSVVYQKRHVCSF